MPLNGLAKRIISGNTNQVLCQVTLTLISKHQRPYLFSARVQGLPPHAVVRYYEVTGWHEDDAAFHAMEIFKGQMLNPLMRYLTGTE